MKRTEYKPMPKDTSDVVLSDGLSGLIEAMARNVHEVWAARRIAEGWKYGCNRSDTLKEHPCLVPYEELTELERDYDRSTALETLKFIISKGYVVFQVNKIAEKDDYK